MRNYIVVILLVINCCTFFGQNKDADKLKNYVSYTEENYGSGGWSKRRTINKKGFVRIEENYLNKKLRSRFEYYYDEYDNRSKEIQTFDPNDGVVSEEFNYELVVNSNGYISKNFMGIYSDFTELGKPQVVVSEHWMGFKEEYEYDVKGNITKWVFYSRLIDSDNKEYIRKQTTLYSYDKYNNVIRLYRSNDPKEEFPMLMIGGPAKYEYEKFRYVYNKDGLWKKKFKAIEGKEYLVKKRKYTKR